MRHPDVTFVAEAGQPTMSLDRIAEMASDILGEWPYHHAFPSPFHVAASIGLGLRSAPGLPCAWFATDDAVVFSDEGTDRERGVLVAHAVAHVALRRAGCTYCQADAWRLAAEFLCHHRAAVAIPVDDLLDSQPWATRDFLAKWSEFCADAYDDVASSHVRAG